MLEDLDQGDVAETVKIFFEASQIVAPVKKATLSIQDVSFCKIPCHTFWGRFGLKECIYGTVKSPTYASKYFFPTKIKVTTPRGIGREALELKEVNDCSIFGFLA